MDGRQILNVALIVHETLNDSRPSKNALIVQKVDFGKAYVE